MNDESVKTSPEAIIRDVAAQMPSACDLKVRINTLLWEVLPSATSLGRAESIACMMFTRIEREWDKHEPSTPS